MTSWIDASFVYSTSEAWVNAMRSFQNGTFRQGEIEGIPPRNAERVPIFTAPAPHIMKMSNPEKMLCKSSSAQRWKSLKLTNVLLMNSAGRSTDESKPRHLGDRHHHVPLSQLHGAKDSREAPDVERRRDLSASSPLRHGNSSGLQIMHRPFCNG